MSTYTYPKKHQSRSSNTYACNLSIHRYTHTPLGVVNVDTVSRTKPCRISLRRTKRATLAAASLGGGSYKLDYTCIRHSRHYIRGMVSPAAHDGGGTAVVLVGRPAVVTSIRRGRARRHSNVLNSRRRTAACNIAHRHGTPVVAPTTAAARRSFWWVARRW